MRKVSYVSWFKIQHSSLFLQRKEKSRDCSKGKAVYLLMEERIYQIKGQNCAASFLSVIHPKWSTVWTARSDFPRIIVWKESTPFKS